MSRTSARAGSPGASEPAATSATMDVSIVSGAAWNSVTLATLAHR